MSIFSLLLAAGCPIPFDSISLHFVFDFLISFIIFWLTLCIMSYSVTVC